MNGFLVEQTQELLQKWDTRTHGLRPHMEICGEGLTLGAGTVSRDGAARNGPRLTFGVERRDMALLATAYGQPGVACVLAKLTHATCYRRFSVRAIRR